MLLFTQLQSRLPFDWSWNMPRTLALVMLLALWILPSNILMTQRLPSLYSQNKELYSKPQIIPISKTPNAPITLIYFHVFILQKFLKWGLLHSGSPWELHRSSVMPNGFHNNMMILFAFFTVSSFALMMSEQWWVKLLARWHKSRDDTTQYY